MRSKPTGPKLVIGAEAKEETWRLSTASMRTVRTRHCFTSGHRGPAPPVLTLIFPWNSRLCGQLPAGPAHAGVDRPVGPAGGEPVRLERRGQPGAVHQLEREGAQQRRRSRKDMLLILKSRFDGFSLVLKVLYTVEL